MKTATQLLQKYTFEPVKPKLRVEQHSLAVQHQDRAIPFGHFKIRLKNINSQQSYLLELKQALQLTTTTGLQLRSRLHGVHVQHARHLVPGGYHVLASLTIKTTPQASHGFAHKKVQATYSVPVTGHYAQSLPTQIPLYAFTDNHQLAINQRALATLFLQALQPQALNKVG
ncbi:hypothetical protein RXV91_07505 [Lactiplantibacillus sp. DA1]|uniref:hypothetical protein n=1 Tax=Lactiplantibacillus sp. DA1 TaxID=3079857 RepID=UPI00292A62C7|nr:hypothetical protein [Lactiplantibacillus sp. DA1]MDV0430713.1 hypothetical protein [Lactiplantibacillus sp. DA1]